MSQPKTQQLSHDDAANDPSEAQSILAALRALRSRIVVAWQERGVMLSPEEQKEFRDEVNATCTLLADLTASS